MAEKPPFKLKPTKAVIDDVEIIPLSDIIPDLEIQNPPKIHNSFSDHKYSGSELYNFDHQELPKLVDPIFPKSGLASLVGSSDTGKSTILRQLALSVAFGMDSFVGYKLNPSTRNVIYISTEDDPVSTSVSIKKVVNHLVAKYKIDTNGLDHLKFYFEADLSPDSPNYLIKLLEDDLKKVKTDLIIVDAFTDIFSGDINSSTKVREFLGLFSKISKKHDLLVLFLHHTGKGKDKLSASKDNVLGSQAFEAKMRVLVELRKHPTNENQRILAITKGNYLSSEIKRKSKVINFIEENLLFEDIGVDLETATLNALAKNHPQKEQILQQIQVMPKGISIRKIESDLKAKGFNVSKSTVANYLSELKTSNVIENAKDEAIDMLENMDFPVDKSEAPKFSL